MSSLLSDMLGRLLSRGVFPGLPGRGFLSLPLYLPASSPFFSTADGCSCVFHPACCQVALFPPEKTARQPRILMRSHRRLPYGSFCLSCLLLRNAGSEAPGITGVRRVSTFRQDGSCTAQLPSCLVLCRGAVTLRTTDFSFSQRDYRSIRPEQRFSSDSSKKTIAIRNSDTLLKNCPKSGNHSK